MKPSNTKQVWPGPIHTSNMMQVWTEERKRTSCLTLHWPITKSLWIVDSSCCSGWKTSNKLYLNWSFSHHKFRHSLLYRLICIICHFLWKSPVPVRIMTDDVTMFPVIRLVSGQTVNGVQHNGEGMASPTPPLNVLSWHFYCNSDQSSLHMSKSNQS